MYHISFSIRAWSLCDTNQCQAALGVSASYDALIDLFNCISNFLKRLHIYTDMTRLTPALSDILVKIMVEVLSVLSLATKQINQGRLSRLIPCLPADLPSLIVIQRNLP
jgi:hypothetical protein